MIRAIVGLGNEGAKYRTTYHNAGAFVAAQIVQLAGADDAARALRQYPLSGFMNESGGPVHGWLKLNNLAVSDIVVAHDDSDLPLGTFKLTRGGGSAGHKGIESLVQHLGTGDFWRLRIGIRDPREVVRTKAEEFVLNEWSAKDEEEFVQVAARAWREIQKLEPNTT